jgi:small subunit ribosomal protein S1
VEKFNIGDLVEGVVVSVLDFGAFVELAEGLHGLVHISEIGYANAEDPKAVVKKRDPVLVKIMGIDTDRERVSLSMRRVPLSEQMEWIMNLEDVKENILLDGEEEIEEEESADQSEEVSDPDERTETEPENSTEIEKDADNLEARSITEQDPEPEVENKNEDQPSDDDPSDSDVSEQVEESQD